MNYKEPTIYVEGRIIGQEQKDKEIVTTIELALSKLNYLLQKQDLRKTSFKIYKRKEKQNEKEKNCEV